MSKHWTQSAKVHAETYLAAQAAELEHVGVCRRGLVKPERKQTGV